MMKEYIAYVCNVFIVHVCWNEVKAISYEAMHSFLLLTMSQSTTNIRMQHWTHIVSLAMDGPLA